MLPKLVEAHLSGQSCRQISAWLRPPVAHTTIYRYIKEHVTPVMTNSRALAALLKNNSKDTKPIESVLTDHVAALQHPATDPATLATDMAKKAILGAPILAIRENRIAAQQARHKLLEQVREERAADMSVCEDCRRSRADHPNDACNLYKEVPGGKTGLVVRKLKPQGMEYALDTGLLTEFREHEKQVAQEMGQWNESAPAGAVSIQVICPSGPGESPRVSFAAPNALELPAAPDQDEDGISEIALRPE